MKRIAQVDLAAPSAVLHPSPSGQHRFHVRRRAAADPEVEFERAETAGDVNASAAPAALPKTHSRNEGTVAAWPSTGVRRTPGMAGAAGSRKPRPEGEPTTLQTPPLCARPPSPTQTITGPRTITTNTRTLRMLPNSPDNDLGTDTHPDKPRNCIQECNAIILEGLTSNAVYKCSRG